MSILTEIEHRAKAAYPKIIFPEADEPRILQVAEQTALRKLAQPVLLGDAEAILALAAQTGVDLSGVTIITPDDAVKADYAARFAAEDPMMTEKMVLRKLRNPLYFAACAVHFHDADSFIAGYHYTTGEVILAASTFIGRAENVNTISSFNLVTIPGFEGGEQGSVIFTDVAVCVDPEPEQLADIAMLAADAGRKLLSWEPRVAFLSYSTKGSGESEKIRRITDALSILQARRPDLNADGEFQLEVALSASAAQKKLEQVGDVAGQANVIVFPDLNAGNTNIKAVKLFSRANSIGPILTGFREPISDLSRTGSLEHLLGTVATVAALCRKA